MPSLVIHYKELALKGKNRPWFVQVLIRNLKTTLKGLGIITVKSVMGRIEIEYAEGSDKAEISARLSRVCGIANFSHAGRASLDFDDIARAVLADMGDQTAASFRVSVRRADKRFPMTSPQIEREIGGRIKQARGWPVNLSHPALTVHVEMLPEYSCYYVSKEPGAGGMPVGTAGRVAVLISGGIDSPVAAFRMIRRGCRVLFIHFHSYPILSRASQEKVREIVTLLTKYQLRSRLVLVPFGELQQQVVLSVPPELRVVIYRRLMLRIAERLATRGKSRALVTGEAIGQVASQTLENMTVIARAADMEILRPLVGMDKDEIADMAASLGTLAISNIPDQDCCTLFTPRHPATRARETQVVEAEGRLAIDDLVADAINRSVVEDFTFPVLT